MRNLRIPVGLIRCGLGLVLTASVMAPATEVSAGVHELLTVTDNSADTTVPVTDLLMVTITTDASQGGNDATATLVSIGGSVVASDVADIAVFYNAVLVTRITNPATLTDLSISLPGTQSGKRVWTYFISLNASAGGKTFNMTVTSITGTDNAVLPFTTATRNAIAGNQAPTATINSPADASSIGGPGPYVIDGTASDSDGTVQSVTLTIARPSGAPTEWWNGTGWQGSSTTVAANNTGTNYSTWNYSWNWTSDMEGTGVDITAVADDGTDTGSDTNTTTVDTTAPRVDSGTYTNGVGFNPEPTSGDASFTLRSMWTEANPGTPQFDYDLNDTGDTGTWSDGSAGADSTKTYAVPLTGSDYFTGITSRHADSPYGNGPTTTADTGPFYVLPLTPNPPTVANNGTTDSLDVTINANPGEGGTGMLYAIKCDTAGGFVQADFTCDATEVWQTLTAWGTPVTVTGLNQGALYAFSVAAGNPKDTTPSTAERSASAYSGTGSDTTSAGNQAPTVTITGPLDASNFDEAATIDFTGTANDPEDGDLTASLSWTSSIDSPPDIGSGGSFSRNDLSIGVHTITAEATDSGALTGQDQITVTVNNVTPTVTITQPAVDPNTTQGDSITFSATATDPGQGDISASLSWSSNLDGVIGSGASFATTTLSVGVHTITASVPDPDGGADGQDQVTVTVNAPPADDVTPNPPTAAIDNCNQITVTVTFTGDDNNNSTTTFERSPNGVDTWTAVATCGAVGGTSPRSCVDTTVADNSTNYYRTDFTDSDGVIGTDPSTAIGPYDTSLYCSVDGTTIDANSAEATTCTLMTTTSVFTGDDDGDGYTEVQFNTTNSFPGTVACAQSNGGSPRQCRIPGLTASQDYWLRFHYVDPDGVVGGAAPQDHVIGPINTGTCSGDGIAPTVMAIAPSRNAVIGGTDTVKVQVFDDPIGGVTVAWSVDGGGTNAASINANYDCGTNCSVFEFDLDTTSTGENLNNGSHSLSIEATDSDGHVSKLGLAVTVNNSGDKAAGSGFLLRRTHGSQLCIDCHNLPTHSSQHTSSKYGNWAMDCTTCHTPHKTTNIYLIDNTIDTPNSGPRPVRFETKAGAAADSSVAGTASYVNEDNASEVDGVCQACHTRTSDTSGTVARWRNSDSGGNVDSHYDSSGTSACTGCHTHDAGFSGAGGACNTCHFAPPTVGKHGSHDEVGTLPTDYDGLVSTTTPTEYGFACAKCHSGSHFNDPATPHTVEVVFDATVDPQNAGGSYVAGTPETPDPGTNGDGWNWSDGTCGNLYCHSNSAPLGGTDSRKTPTWDQAAAFTCASCHNTAASDDGGGTATDLSDTHGKHIQSTSGETGSYAFTCDECHAQTIKDGPADPWNLTGADFSATAGQGKVQHVDGGKDVFFSATATTSGIDQSAGSFIGDPNYTCSGTYCHSPGNKTSAFDPPVGTVLTWNGGTSTCRSCHAGDAAASPTMDSGKHENHVNNTGIIGDNYECAACHSITVTAGDNETITTFGNHVNGTSDISGTLVDTTYVSPTCTSSYCHSSGQASGASFEYYASPDWFTGTANALDCKGCHGRHTAPNVTSNFGEPNYQNGGAGDVNANSHDPHVSAATDCTKCHNTTTSNGTQILAAAPHTDQARDVVIAASWDTNGGSGNYTAGTKTCNNIACHGAGTPQWGAALVCLDCHSGTEGDALGNGIPNGVADEWLTDGHGAAAGGSLNSALGGCDYCHQLDAAHTPTASTSPYRLRFSATDNQLCLRCHATGDLGISQNSEGTALTGVDSSLDVDTAHFGAKHQQPEGGELCWDCHDPHGVPTNILMVKSQVSQASDTYGVPGTTVAVTFTDNTTAGQAVGRLTENTNTPRQGICQACHDPTKGTNTTTGSVKYWRSDGTDDPNNDNNPVPSAHNAAKLCTDCHFHTADFAGAGGDCLGCHGDGSGAPARRAVLADFSRNSHHVGTGVGLMGGALTNFDCVVCHAEGKVDGSETSTTGQPHMDGVIDLRDTDHATNYYSYDKDAVGTSAGNYTNWNSSNLTWKTQQSANMDPFCLSCHDFDGATASFNSTDGGVALNPFGDTQITNEYDQMLRDPTWTDLNDDGIQDIGEFNPPWAGDLGGDGPGRVTDIASKVADEWRPASGGYSAADLDTDAGRLAQSIDDPPEGIYSRHAINGGALSVYETSDPEWGKVDYWNRTEVAWNETFVMSCADCHTNDGASGQDAEYGATVGTGIGNAHGSDSEYLLKDGAGGALEGTKGTTPGTAGSYNCFLCHSSYYSADPHFGNSGDYQGYEGETGISRIPAGNDGGGIYGYACANCHGGIGFGSIHGTSQIFVNGAGGSREAYRFTNGASMRFYDPSGWTGEAASCYTLASRDEPWGGCTKHAGGKGHSKPLAGRRPLAY